MRALPAADGPLLAPQASTGPSLPGIPPARTPHPLHTPLLAPDLRVGSRLPFACSARTGRAPPRSTGTSHSDMATPPARPRSEPPPWARPSPRLCTFDLVARSGRPPKPPAPQSTRSTAPDTRCPGVSSGPPGDPGRHSRTEPGHPGKAKHVPRADLGLHPAGRPTLTNAPQLCPARSAAGGTALVTASTRHPGPTLQVSLCSGSGPRPCTPAGGPRSGGCDSDNPI